MQQIKKREYDVVAELIQGYLAEMELVTFDTLPATKDVVRALKKQKFFEKGITTKKLECEIGDETVLFICFDKGPNFETQFQLLTAEMFEEDVPQACHFVVFIRDIATKKTVEQLKPKLQGWVGDQIAKLIGKKKPKVHFSVLHLPAQEEMNFSIAIKSRVCALHYVPEPEQPVQIASNVYVARLFDIVKLYGQVGTKLFERNVRYHVKDLLNVEPEIHQTLMSQPENFFNLNNGIAIQMGRYEALDTRDDRCINLTYAEEGDLSVINGAQTISAAADFFFQPVDNKSADTFQKIDNAKKQAWVLLRVFYSKSSQQKDCVTEFNKISISLNRQKPIHAMDIGYTCPEVAEINKLCEANQTDPYYFKILKRGQNETGRTGWFKYQLSDFGRMVTAYYGNDPARARADTTQAIIRYKEPTADDHEAQELSSIYAPLTKSNDKISLFMQWYKPMNFAKAMAQLYIQADKQYRKEQEIDDNILAVLGNGRYFFIAYVVNMLNNSPTATKSPSFSTFDYTARHVQDAETEVTGLIYEYAKLVAKFAEEYLEIADSDKKQTRNTLNSNDFKKPDFYIKWQAHAKEEKDVLEWNQKMRHALCRDDAKESAMP